MVDGNTSAMGVSVNVPFVPYSGDGFVTMVKVFLLGVLYEAGAVEYNTKIFVSKKVQIIKNTQRNYGPHTTISNTSL